MVFCVHDDTDAFLETYIDNKIAIYHKPVWFVSLNDVQHISPTICAHEQEYEFVLTLSTEVVRLAAPTWEQMLDWVESLRGKLYELRILNPKENVYSKLPDRNLPLLPTRDPTSPLPPPPTAVPPELLPGTEPISSSSDLALVTSSPIYQRRRSESQSSATYRRLNASEPQASSNTTTQIEVFNFENVGNILRDSQTQPTSAPTTATNSNAHYELLFQTPGPSSRNVDSIEANNRLLERSTSCSPRILQPPPHPYKTLREQQVMQLQKEMKHPSGVRIQLRRKDCISSIGFVDAFDAVW